MNSFACLFFFLSIAGISARAQVLTSLSALQDGSRVVLSFTMAAGNTCSDIEILRSADSLSFQVIGSIAGVCGSTTNDVSYSYIDPAPPENSVIYYRLDLKTLGFSEIIRIRTFTGNESFILYPVPATTGMNIFTLPGEPRLENISIGDITGKMIRFREPAGENPFYIPLNDLHAGVYFILLEMSNGVVEKRMFTFAGE
jgi:hypothetical protein